MSRSALALSGVDFRHGAGPPLFRRLDLAVEHGEVVALVGPSGCGKSSLLRICSGLEAPGGGRRECRVDAISQVFQSPCLLPWRSALENVMLPAELGPRGGLGRQSRETTRARANDLLTSVGLGPDGDKIPVQMSLGMQMRTALARALMASPGLLLLDEPFAAVDEPTRVRLDRLFVEVHGRRPFAAVFVTHSAREAVAVAHRIVILGDPPDGVAEVVEVTPLGGRPGLPPGDRRGAIIEQDVLGRLDAIIEARR